MESSAARSGLLSALVALAYMVGFLGFYIGSGFLLAWLFPVNPLADDTRFWLIIPAGICGFLGGWLVSMLPAAFLNREHPAAHLHFGYLSAIAMVGSFVLTVYTPHLLYLPFRGAVLPVLSFVSLTTAYVISLRLAARRPQPSSSVADTVQS